ncbi:MAG TPA: hypothetical protein VJ484_07190 [Lysobacter sp.]|nr:hypothetical protein [Lysobacter sp.]
MTEVDTAWEEPTPRHVSVPSRSASQLPMNGAEAQARLQAKRAQERKKIDRVVAAGRSKLVGRYESQPIDHAWATVKRAELMELGTSEQIEAIQAQPTSLGVDCRTSVCRIGADFPSQTAAEDWATLYLISEGANLPQASMKASVNPDGSVHLDVYAHAKPDTTAHSSSDRSRR